MLPVSVVAQIIEAGRSMLYEQLESGAMDAVAGCEPAACPGALRPITNRHVAV